MEEVLQIFDQKHPKHRFLFLIGKFFLYSYNKSFIIRLVKITIYINKLSFEYTKVRLGGTSIEKKNH